MSELGVQIPEMDDSEWNIVPSLDDQSKIMNDLATTMAQANVNQAPTTPTDATPAAAPASAQAKLIQDIFGNSGNNTLAKTNQNIVTKAIANQGQLIPIPGAAPSGSSSDNSDLKKLLAAVQQSSAQATSQSAAPAKSSGGGDNPLGDLGAVADVAETVAAWIICTELFRQGKMPRSWYIAGGPVFAAYPEVGKRGYYIWAIPSVRHMRAHPDSYYSKFLGMIFLWRVENIAAHRGVKGARKLLRGAAVTAILYPTCRVLGAALWLLGKDMNWMQVYGAKE